MKNFKWKSGKQKITCVVDGKTSMKRLKNYLDMMLLMTRNKWVPDGWKLETKRYF